MLFDPQSAVIHGSFLCCGILSPYMAQKKNSNQGFKKILG